ncbi:hypothetical protein DRN86_00090 [Candidatus Geothermarchaeota archaeon]|nr:MAG: hypothetical protein DRN86_00090 [Candidatus Geothermarchaeota archaeon]
MKENLGLWGILEIRVYDRKGKLKAYIKKKNLIVNVGKAKVAGLINGVVSGPFTYVAIGTGDPSNPGTCTAPSPDDTALQNEVARAQATTSRTTTNVSNDTAVWDVEFTATASWAVCEAGIFDSQSGGTMLARQTFSTINLASGDKIAITWKVVIQ